jgi:hypothetical protein
MLCTLGFSKTSLVQFDAPRMTLCVAITGWDSLENTQFVVIIPLLEKTFDGKSTGMFQV